MYLAGRVVPNSEARTEVFGFLVSVFSVSISVFFLFEPALKLHFYHLAFKSEIPYELVPRARE